MLFNNNKFTFFMNVNFKSVVTTARIGENLSTAKVINCFGPLCPWGQGSKGEPFGPREEGGGLFFCGI
jgi:hypothetical protein